MVLKALFIVKDGEMDFTRAIEISIKAENAAKIARDTFHMAKPIPVHKVPPWHASKAKEAAPITSKSAATTVVMKPMTHRNAVSMTPSVNSV